MLLFFPPPRQTVIIFDLLSKISTHFVFLDEFGHLLPITDMQQVRPGGDFHTAVEANVRRRGVMFGFPPRRCDYFSLSFELLCFSPTGGIPHWWRLMLPSQQATSYLVSDELWSVHYWSEDEGRRRAEKKMVQVAVQSGN